MIRCDVLGVPFDAVTPEEAVRKGLALMETGGRVVTPNPEILWLCHTDPAVMDAVAGADLILADGVGVTRAARKLGRPLPCRVTGADWLSRMLGVCAENGKKVFFLGGKPGVAETAARNCPGVTVCGVHDGYFKEDGPVLEAVREAKPDVLIVCLGAPKQELWMYRNREALSGILMAGLGGSLDVLAGHVKRAPVWIQKIGFEWLYRALRQPSRVKRLFVIPKFLRAVAKQKKREKKNG
ncbi:MAG: WecB/TagA/CpsF family glycosyltransferase [Oscillospiraceae bacterium]|jgi:N-acetylglucosaminyldiphosphoundecaprenol N-acetyl-beta-D-mannosaminyltransferase|nr:WecB/TagA/CpsF family glycosyltransferase [Oscillospiraceae bacterium]